LAVLAIFGGFLFAAALLTSGQQLEPTQRLAFRAIADSDGAIQISKAQELLESPLAPAYTVLDTQRKEYPFWLLTDTFRAIDKDGMALEINSKHIRSAELWLINEHGYIVSYSATGSNGISGFTRDRAGVSLSIPPIDGDLRALVRTSASGPAKITVQLWNSEALSKATNRYNTNGGLLFGCLLMLAGFGALVSLLTRDWAFFIFAGWVITSLRISSYMAGWDMSWMGLSALEEYPVLSRNIPLAAYAILMIALFRSIFAGELNKRLEKTIISALTAISPLLLLAGVLLPHEQYLPVLWTVAGPSLLLLMWLTARIFFTTGSSVALWYGGSWIVTLGGAAAEIGYASGLLSAKPPLLNGVSGAVISAALAGVALAERIKVERAERVAAQKQSYTLLERFRENYNSMPIGLFSAKPDGTIVLRNPEFSKIFDLDDTTSEVALSELLGVRPARTVLQAVESTPVADCEVLAEKIEGEPRWFLARIKRSAEGIEGSIQDISARKQAEAKLKRLVTHDSLTGVLNRRGLDIALERLLDSARMGNSCAVAYVDLDRFKVVNDLHGHATGDAVLRVVAQRLQESVRIQDAVARIADSFLVVFNDCPDYAVSGLSERIREAISGQPFEANGKVLSVTVSIGVVQVDPVMQAVDVIATADRACMEAKAQGRNRVVFLNDKDNSLRAHLDEMKLVADMHGNALTDRYFLEFQPIVALTSAQLSLNYEVLIRMRGLDGEVIPPGRFIGAAERNGLMSHIDRWVLKSTLEWLDSHPAHRDRLNFATLNISGASLNDARFVEDAFAMIADHPLAVSKLCFEITESVALHDIGSTRNFVERLRRCGAKLALDDFGAGYTSFNYLKEIPADLIKIDGSFVRDINRNPANYAITRMIVDLTHELGMESIAEWAETPDTIKALIGLGVDYGQGYGLARPMDKEIVTAAKSGLELVKDQRVAELISRARDVRIHMV
jgi:diguanylate cyclase (GGDEF)-like protein